MSFDEEIIKKVWEKGSIVQKYDPTKFRKDECGAWIIWEKYGDRNSDYGWEIDHISPGGSDNISNLRPLQYKNNIDKSDGKLKCNVTASGVHNIEK